MRRLYLISDEITHPVAAALCAIFDAAAPTDAPFLLTINCGGGDTGAAYALIASMQNCAVPVHTYGVGYLASAAVDILFAGAERGLHPNAICMTHGVVGLTNAQEKTISRARDKQLYERSDYISSRWSWFFGRKMRYHAPLEMIGYGFVDYVASQPTMK